MEASYSEWERVIIGTTHLYMKFNIFRAKKLLSLFKLSRGVCSNRDNFFIYFLVLLLYDAFAMEIFAAFNIFSMKMP